MSDDGECVRIKWIPAIPRASRGAHCVTTAHRGAYCVQLRLGGTEVGPGQELAVGMMVTL